MDTTIVPGDSMPKEPDFNSTADRQTESVLRDFANFVGAGDIALDDVLGIECELDSFLARIIPYTFPDRILIDIDVMQLDLSDPAEDLRKLTLLHRWNLRGIAEFRWVCSVSEENELSLCRLERVSECSGPNLVRVVEEGLKWAESLRDGWANPEILEKVCTNPPVDKGQINFAILA